MHSLVKTPRRIYIHIKGIATSIAAIYITKTSGKLYINIVKAPRKLRKTLNKIHFYRAKASV